MAVQLVEGGLQSYSPTQLARTTLKKGTSTSKTTPSKPSKTGPSSVGGTTKQPTSTPSAPTTPTQAQSTPQAMSVSRQEQVKAIQQKSIISIIARQREAERRSKLISSRQSPTPSASLLTGKTPQQKEALLDLYSRGGYVTSFGAVVEPDQPRYGMGQQLETQGPIKQVVNKAAEITGAKFVYEKGYLPVLETTRTKITRPIAELVGFTPVKLAQLEEAARISTKINVGKIETGLALTKKQKILYTQPIAKLNEPYNIGFGILEEAQYEFVEQPYKTAALLSVGFGSRFIFGSKTFAAAALKEPIGAKAITTGLGWLYAGATAYNLFTQPTSREFGKALGRTGIELAAFGVGAKLYDITYKPIKITKVTGGVRRKARLSEVQQIEFTPDGRELTRTDFVITRQTLPKREVRITTKFREGFGLKPSKLYTLPERTSIVKTFAGSKSYTEFNIPLYQLKGGYKATKVGEPLGLRTGKPVELYPGSKKLTSIQKKLLFDVVKAKVGRPVAVKNIEKVLPEARFIEQIGRTESLGGRLKVGKGQTKISKPGKVSTLYQTVAVVEPGLKIKTGQFYNVVAAYKPLKVSTPRASGKPLITEGYVFQVYEPKDLRPSSTKFITPTNIKKTPFSSTFQQQIQTGLSSLGITPKPAQSIKPIKVTPVNKGSPLATINSITTTSVFAGQGLYERTEEKSMVISKAKPKELVFTGNDYRLRNRITTRQVTIQDNVQELDNINRSVTRQRSVLVQVPKEAIEQRISQEQQVEQRQAQRQILRQVLRPVVRPVPSNVPFPKTPVPKEPPVPKFKLYKQPKFTMGGYGKFTILGRRFGKFKVVGRARSEKEAFSFGSNWARKTLGVTFKVQGAKGRKLPGFKTKQTKEGTLYIEPLGKRLKKGTGEVPEINFYRGIKTRVKI